MSRGTRDGHAARSHGVRPSVVCPQTGWGEEDGSGWADDISPDLLESVNALDKGTFVELGFAMLVRFLDSEPASAVRFGSLLMHWGLARDAEGTDTRVAPSRDDTPPAWHWRTSRRRNIQRIRVIVLGRCLD